MIPSSEALIVAPLEERQIMRVIKDSSEIFFLFLNEYIYCDPPQQNHLSKKVLIRGQNLCFYTEI